MFRGITSTTIDANGRISIPTKHRDEINAACGGHLVITVDIDRCLLISSKIVNFYNLTHPKIMDEFGVLAPV